MCISAPVCESEGCALVPRPAAVQRETADLYGKGGFFEASTLEQEEESKSPGEGGGVKQLRVSL